MSYVIDTNVAIHVRDGDQPMIERVIALEALTSLSILSLVELENGVQRDAALVMSRRNILDAMLMKFAVVGFDRRVVHAYGQIVATLGFSRRKIIDRLIAATAIVHELTLITVNGEDFADIPGLKLQVWPVQ